MKLPGITPYTPICQDITFDYLLHSGVDTLCLNGRHLLVFVYAGELLIEEGTKQTTIRCGECVFIRSCMQIILVKKSIAEESFRGVCLGLGYTFLWDFYMKLDRDKRPGRHCCFNNSIVKLPFTVYIESLYVSFIPYLNLNAKLSGHMLMLKSREVVYCLLMADDRFYSCLFYPLYCGIDSAELFLN